ncbi:MAG: oxidoreductase [Gammaproteobacteria bacterium]|nr:oxidoreductase [Gammaproteobacteria bacterium]
MAIVWQKKVDGVHYEVRAAGNTRRLYTDGVFHSQYNANNPVTGSIWDLLLLPAFFYPKGHISRILVLGVGGGAVLKQFNYFLQPKEIVGVELNPIHLFIARRFFKLTQKNLVLYEADAVQWLQAYNGAPFDLIVDDLFGAQDGEPVRAVNVDHTWVRKLLTHLAVDGMVVTNFVSRSELRRSAYVLNPKIRERFCCAFQLMAPRYDNAIGAFLKKTSSSRILRQNLMTMRYLNPDLKTCRLSYYLRRIYTNGQ